MLAGKPCQPRSLKTDHLPWPCASSHVLPLRHERPSAICLAYAGVTGICKTATKSSLSQRHTVAAGNQKHLQKEGTKALAKGLRSLGHSDRGTADLCLQAQTMVHDGKH